MGAAAHLTLEVDGAKWTLACSYTKATDRATGELARAKKWQILSYNYHQPSSCKGAPMKKALLALRNSLQGIQIYLVGGVRWIRPVTDADPSLHAADDI